MSDSRFPASFLFLSSIFKHSFIHEGAWDQNSVSHSFLLIDARPDRIVSRPAISYDKSTLLKKSSVTFHSAQLSDDTRTELTLILLLLVTVFIPFAAALF